MKSFFPVVAAAMLTLGACTWVKMEPDGARIRVLAADADTAGCVARGEIGVSVKDKVGLYRRNEIKVRDELETMARNEAVGLSANAIKPLDEPSFGEQRFSAYRCGNALPGTSALRTTPPASQPLKLEEAETYPVREE
jgi:hypothetical protein